MIENRSVVTEGYRSGKMIARGSTREFWEWWNIPDCDHSYMARHVLKLRAVYSSKIGGF